MNGHKRGAEAVGYDVSVGEHSAGLEGAPRGVLELAERQM